MFIWFGLNNIILHYYSWKYWLHIRPESKILSPKCQKDSLSFSSVCMQLCPSLTCSCKLLVSMLLYNNTRLLQMLQGKTKLLVTFPTSVIKKVKYDPSNLRSLLKPSSSHFACFNLSSPACFPISTLILKADALFEKDQSSAALSQETAVSSWSRWYYWFLQDQSHQLFILYSSWKELDMRTRWGGDSNLLCNLHGFFTKVTTCGTGVHKEVEVCCFCVLSFTFSLNLPYRTRTGRKSFSEKWEGGRFLHSHWELWRQSPFTLCAQFCVLLQTLEDAWSSVSFFPDECLPRCLVFE